MYEDMAAVAESLDDPNDVQLAAEAAAAEIRAALRLTRRAADSELSFAMDLRQRLPRLWDRLAAGDVDLRRAKTIRYGTTHLPDGTARLVVDRVLDDAPRLTTGQLAARIRKLCIEVDPDQAKERYEQAVDERRFVSELTESGTVNLYGLDLPPDQAAAAAARINHLALSLDTGSESRTIDQLRADVFLDLVCGNTTHTGSTGKGAVNISVDLETLARLADHPGELAGYGPVIADIARQITDQQTSQWRYTVTDPNTGLSLHHGITRRRPTAGQRRHVETHNLTCIFPGCRMPSVDCDLDHRTQYADGGPTTTSNLAPLCRHDHRIRHQTGWAHQPLPDGDHQWTSRLGHTYTTSGAPP
jgi:hypothetical protein